MKKNIKVVVEPALVNKSQNKHFSAFIKVKGDEMLFPHVDSCLAVVIEHQDGSFSGVHVPQVWDSKSDFALKDNLSKALTEGEVHLEKVKIKQIYCVGDLSWKEIARSKLLSGSKFKFEFKETGLHGSDVRVVQGKSGIEVTDTAFAP